MNKFLNLILGTTDVPTYIAGFIFALIGLAFYWRAKLKSRNRLSKTTPPYFSLGFFTQDNLVELVFSILAIFLGLRFSIEYAGVKVTMIYSLLLGYGLPRFVGWLSKIQAKARK